MCGQFIMANLKVEYCCRMRGTCQERKQKKLFLLFLLSHVVGEMHNGPDVVDLFIKLRRFLVLN
jgi:hypothetical protein